MHQWGGGSAWFINMPVWAPAAFALLAPLFILFMVWSIFWKGLALWHSAQRGQSWWFVILLLVNTLGILEIIYLFGVAKLHMHDLFSKHPHNHH